MSDATGSLMCSGSSGKLYYKTASNKLIYRDKYLWRISWTGLFDNGGEHYADGIAEGYFAYSPSQFHLLEWPYMVTCGFSAYTQDGYDDDENKSVTTDLSAVYVRFFKGDWGSYGGGYPIAYFDNSTSPADFTASYTLRYRKTAGVTVSNTLGDIQVQRL
jgi:hypothetical protein